MTLLDERLEWVKRAMVAELERQRIYSSPMPRRARIITVLLRA